MIFAFILLLTLQNAIATSVSFLTSGTWTCPGGVTLVHVVGIAGGCGGGGGGGGGSGNATLGAGGGGPGGSGMRSLPQSIAIDVVPGTVYGIVVGTGGAGGSGGAPGANGAIGQRSTAQITAFDTLAYWHPGIVQNFAQTYGSSWGGMPGSAGSLNAAGVTLYYTTSWMWNSARGYDQDVYGKGGTRGLPGSNNYHGDWYGSPFAFDGTFTPINNAAGGAATPGTANGGGGGGAAGVFTNYAGYNPVPGAAGAGGVAGVPGGDAANSPDAPSTAYGAGGLGGSGGGGGGAGAAGGKGGNGGAGGPGRLDIFF